MAGLLDFGSNPYAGLLSEEDLAGARRQATTDALLKLSAGLFQAGAPSRTPRSLGAALVGGLQGVGAGYQGTLQQAAQQKLMQQKLQADLQSKQRTTDAQKLVGGLYRPAQAATQGIMDSPDVVVPPRPATPGGINQDVMSQLMSLGPEGQKAIMDRLKTQEMMRGEAFNLSPGDVRSRTDIFGNTTEVASGAPKVVDPKLASDFAKAVDSLGYQRKNASEYSEQERAAINKKMNEFAQTSRQIIMNEGQRGFQNTSDLKKQFAGEPIYKAYEDMRMSYGQVASAINAGTPIGDVGGATKIMKLLDPGSVVRESELGMAMAAGGRMDRLKNYFKQSIDGTKLTATQRKDFKSLASELYNVAASLYNSKRTEYSDLAEAFNLNANLALGNPAKIEGEIKRIGWEQ
tara:strand:+ start:3893 stop:5104 length:1212 start_codon:yes stop_codon:yes gene_type:complete